jgi:hypothetical protein
MNILLEKKRKKLNLMLLSDKYSSEEILKVSQELDKLIVCHYKLLQKSQAVS